MKIKPIALIISKRFFGTSIRVLKEGILFGYLRYLITPGLCPAPITTTIVLFPHAAILSIFPARYASRSSINTSAAVGAKLLSSLTRVVTTSCSVI
jgi:hypothetical protein